MRSDSLFVRLAVILTYSVGFQVLFVVVVGFLATEIVSRPVPPQAITASSVLVTNGEPLLSSGHWTGNWADGRKLDGQPVRLMDKQGVDQGTTMLARDDGPLWRTLENSTGWSTMGFTAGRNRSEPWYVILNTYGARSQAYFVNYSNATAAPIRYLGTNGESTTPPPVDEQFQLLSGQQSSLTTDEGYSLQSYHSPSIWDGSIGGFSLSGSIYVLTSKGLDRVDPVTRQVTRIVAEPDLQSIAPRKSLSFDVQYNRPMELARAGSTSLNSMLLLSSTTLYVIEDYQVQTKYVIPETLRGRNLQVFTIDPQSIYYAVSNESNPYYSPNTLLHCDQTGRVIQEWNVPQPAPVPSRRTEEQIFLTTVLPSPMGILAAMRLESILSEHSFWELVSTRQLTIVLTLIVGLLSALLAWQLTPKFSGAPTTPGWIAFMFVTGLPGLVGYLLHFRRRIRPVLEPAPRVGTEIFA